MPNLESAAPQPVESGPTTEEDEFPSAELAPPYLRVGLLIRTTRLSRASIAVIDDVGASDFARIELVLFRPTPGREQPSRNVVQPPLSRVGDALSRVAWGAYARLDRQRVRLVDDPVATEDSSGRLRGIPFVEVTEPGLHGDDRTADHPAASSAGDLDVIIHLGDETDMNRDPRHDLPVDRSIRDAAAHGVWALRWGDPDSTGSGPAFVEEILADAPVSVVSLERLADSRTPGLVLARAAFPIDTGSLARNRVQPTYGSTYLIIQKLRELHASGWEPLARRAVAAPERAPRSRRRPPSIVKLVRWLGPRLVQGVVRRAAMIATRRVPDWQWRIAIRPAGDVGAVERLQDMSGFEWLQPPPGHVQADPFLVAKDGRTWLFFEDVPSPRASGVISCVEVVGGARVGPPVVVIESRGHASYPYVFFDGETACMIPETSAENVVRLYRATEFPYRWDVDRDLYRGPALDTSAWQHDGRWWFFTTLREPRGGALALTLFYADALDQPWTAHPRNPISMDVRNARGAGSIFRENGKVFRPSQDGSRTYGYGFTLNEVITLSTTEYEERPVVTVGPDWSPALFGTHTYARRNGVEATDGKFRVTRRIRA